MIHEHLPRPIGQAADVAALAATVGVVVQFLPAIAALLSIIWTAIRIWETPTVQKLVARIRSSKEPRDVDL